MTWRFKLVASGLVLILLAMPLSALGSCWLHMSPVEHCTCRQIHGHHREPGSSCLRETNQDRTVHAGHLVLQQFRSDLDKKAKSQRGRPQPPGGLYGSGREFSWTRLHAVSPTYSLTRHG